MSKQSVAKEKQGYVAKPVSETCANCEYFKFEVGLPEWMRLENACAAELGRRPRYGSLYEKEKNIRCGIGGFAVKKMGTCNEFVLKTNCKPE